MSRITKKDFSKQLGNDLVNNIFRPKILHAQEETEEDQEVQEVQDVQDI